MADRDAARTRQARERAAALSEMIGRRLGRGGVVGRRLKELVEEMGGDRPVESATGVKKSQASRWRQGEGDAGEGGPRLDTLLRLVHNSGVSLDYVAGYQGVGKYRRDKQTIGAFEAAAKQEIPKAFADRFSGLNPEFVTWALRDWTGRDLVDFAVMSLWERYIQHDVAAARAYARAKEFPRTKQQPGGEFRRLFGDADPLAEMAARQRYQTHGSALGEAPDPLLDEADGTA